MRWNDLFADLEGQLSAAAAAQFNAEVSELTRAERASVEFGARAVATVGGSVTVTMRDGEHVAGTLADASPQWLLVTQGVRQHLIPLEAVSFIGGLSTQAAPLSEVDRRLSVGHAYRALSVDRARVVVHTDATALAGVIGAVGADHVDVATSLGNQARVTVPFAAIIQVRSADGASD
ncbi:MAG: hypothetical protein CVT64_09730 [Actinobacteria bacterium HGW-Actinobacteria-4]|nr:MAG: hypothetical protein CVT64_09730 [Actinobacteria bacterium HGW-Actinobacteria-4]